MLSKGLYIPTQQAEGTARKRYSSGIHLSRSRFREILHRLGARVDLWWERVPGGKAFRIVRGRIRIAGDEMELPESAYTETTASLIV